jgi:hypothetical protein
MVDIDEKILGDDLLIDEEVQSTAPNPDGFFADNDNVSVLRRMITNGLN